VSQQTCERNEIATQKGSGMSELLEQTIIEQTIIEQTSIEESLLSWKTKISPEPHETLTFIDGTEEEFYAIEERKADFFEGIIVMHSPASLQHEEIFGDLFADLRLYVRTRQLGKVLGSRSLIVFSPEHRFEPDILFIADTNIGDWHNEGREFHGVPDVVIEILSKSTRRYDLNIKRMVYQEYGVREIVFVDTLKHCVIIDTKGDADNYSAQTLTTETVGSSVITGFDWNAAELLASV
jgi:Uma2 family endonuclease